MPEKIVQLNEKVIKEQLKGERGSIEEKLNKLLEAETQKLTQVARYVNNKQHHGHRSSRYSHNLTITSGDITLKRPKLKEFSFGTLIC